MQQKYRYRLEDLISTTEVNPLGASDFNITWSKEQEESERDYVKTFDGNIVFTGIAYNQLLTLEQSEYRCRPSTLMIEKNCNGDWNEIFRGKISLNSGEWDLDRCNVKLKFTEEKQSSCLVDNDGEEINYLNFYPKHELKTRPSNINLEFVHFDNNFTQPDQPAGILEVWDYPESPNDGAWRLYMHHQNAQLQNAPAEWIIYADSYWIRQITTVPQGQLPPDESWIYVATEAGLDKYAKQVNLYNYQFTEDVVSPNNVIIHLEYDYIGKNGTNEKIRNAVKLSDVLQMIVDSFCEDLTVVSDFFQINPENASTINYVTEETSKVNHLFLVQASDVKRPTATSQATRGVITWETLSNALQKLFNVEWRVKDGVLRIEHVSYFTKTLGLDLTEPQYEKWMKGKRKYTYKNESLPSKEIWQWSANQSYGDFQGEPIVYNSGCIINTRTTKTHTIEEIFTDVELAFANPTSESNVIPDEGNFLIAGGIDGAGFYILQEEGIMSQPRINNVLAMAQLHRDYHKHNRPFPAGKMNRVDTLFKSVIKTKQGVKFVIPYCCPSELDPEILVRTELGDGEINSVSYNFLREQIELDLAYDSFANLEENTEPIAVFDSVNVHANSTVLIDVLANDTHKEGDEIIIVSQPHRGTATVVGSMIQYEAGAGEPTTFSFLYKIRDAIWGVESNVASISINVLRENTPPTANPDYYQAIENEELTIGAGQGVLANDTDDFGGMFIADHDGVTEQGGTVVMQTDGGFIYTPPTDYTGQDYFEYTVEDSGGLQTVGEVNLIVYEENALIAVEDNYIARSGASFTTDGSPEKRSLIFNDYGLGQATGTINVTPETKSTTLGGTVNIQSNGNFTYTAPLTTGDDSFTYEAFIAGYSSATGTATVKVIPTVKVEIETVPIDTVFLPIDCGINGEQEGIRRDIVSVNLKFFGADDQPIDTTDLGLNVKVKRTRTNELTSEIFTSVQSFLATGFQTTVYEEEYSYERELNCESETILRYNQQFEVEPDSNYVII